jgi:hypothetical protein
MISKGLISFLQTCITKEYSKMINKKSFFGYTIDFIIKRLTGII